MRWYESKTKKKNKWGVAMVFLFSNKAIPPQRNNALVFNFFKSQTTCPPTSPKKETRKGKEKREEKWEEWRKRTYTMILLGRFVHWLARGVYAPGVEAVFHYGSPFGHLSSARFELLCGLVGLGWVGLRMVEVLVGGG